MRRLLLVLGLFAVLLSSVSAGVYPENRYAGIYDSGHIYADSAFWNEADHYWMQDNFLDHYESVHGARLENDVEWNYRYRYSRDNERSYYVRNQAHGIGLRNVDLYDDAYTVKRGKWVGLSHTWDRRYDRLDSFDLDDNDVSTFTYYSHSFDKRYRVACRDEPLKGQLFYVKC